MRTYLYPAMIVGLILFAGPLWCFIARRLNKRWGGEGEEALLVAALGHALLQFLPWAALVFRFFRTGEDVDSMDADSIADTETGLHWEVHVVYTCALVMAAPFLTAIAMDTQSRSPFMELFFFGKSYATSILHAYDQYSDGAVAVVSKLQDWHLADVMIGCFWFGYATQLAAAAALAYHAGGENGDAVWGGFLFFAGVEPGAFAASDKDMAVKSGAMAVAFMKFVTENIPQAALGLMLAKEQTGTERYQTLFSVGLSLMTAAKSFLMAAYFFLPDDIKAFMFRSGPVQGAINMAAGASERAKRAQERHPSLAKVPIPTIVGSQKMERQESWDALGTPDDKDQETVEPAEAADTSPDSGQDGDESGTVKPDRSLLEDAAPAAEEVWGL